MEGPKPSFPSHTSEPKHDRVLQAFQEWKTRPSYGNAAENIIASPHNVEGCLWLAFCEGWKSKESNS